MKKIQKDKVYIECFNSVQEFCNTLETAQTNAFFARRQLDSMDESDAEWYGTPSWSEAQRLMREGDMESMKQLMSGNDAVTVKNASPRTVRRNYFVGQRPHVVNTIMGKPMTMVQRIKKEQAQKVIDIMYDVDASASVSGDTLIKGGRNVVALIQHLEKNGYRVRLSMISGGTAKYNNGKLYNVAGFTVMVKDYRQAINPLLISYLMINPSFMRRHGFRWTETCAHANHHAWQGYGSPMRNVYHYEGNSSNFPDWLKANRVIDSNCYYINVVKSAWADDMTDMLRMVNLTA